MLTGKKILLGVTGSIAAYKAAVLVRLLVKEGVEVRVVMTEASKSFITPLTLATLCKHPVYTEYFDPNNGAWHSHVELGIWPDLMLVAPLSAHTLSAFAQGQCDTLLQAVYLSARCPVWLAPAMDLDMYTHPAVCANLDRVKQFGNKVIDATEGELASGLHGQGRMAEPEAILNALKQYFIDITSRPFAGKRVLITSGPTHEPVDPVRFISNHSTGKMGAALATAFAEQGATVEFITGPAYAIPQHPLIHLHTVKTAEEMATISLRLFPEVHIAVLAAAVADYKPSVKAEHKIKKQTDTLTLILEPTTDIAATLGKMKRSGQVIVGFALETNDEEHHALQKLHKKNMDMIVLNSLRDEGAGFGHDTNKVTLLKPNGEKKMTAIETKQAIARIIRDEIAATLL